MLTDAFQDVYACFSINYCFDGKFLTLTDVVDKLLYADDLADNAKSEENNAKGRRSHVKSM